MYKKKKKNIYNVEGKGLKIDDLIDSGLNKIRLNSDTEEKNLPTPLSPVTFAQGAPAVDSCGQV